MALELSSPSSSPISSSNSGKSGISSAISRNEANGKYLVEIPLLPQPPIQCNNLLELGKTSYVNVVLENVDSSNSNHNEPTYFRVSDDRNEELCRISEERRGARSNRLQRMKGINYLECCDKTGSCVMLIAYPIGLGEVALLSPKEDLLGECQSNVDFICLSVKVKYNFYDVNGSRLMKMTALLREEGDERKFILMVKRSQKEKLALIKMGSLKTCCHIKFKRGQTSVLERLQIIALWIGFMHNELKDTEKPALVEKHAQLQLQKKESRRKKKAPAEAAKSEAPSSPSPSSSSSEEAGEEQGTDDKTGDKNSPEESSSEDNNAETMPMTKWKNLVKSKFSPSKYKREYQVNNNDGEEGNKDDDQDQSKSKKQTASLANKPKS